MKTKFYFITISNCICHCIFFACQKNLFTEPARVMVQRYNLHTDPNPTDPAIANTIGFFLDDWKPKTFTVPAFTDTVFHLLAFVIVNIDASTIITKVPNSVFGNNGNIWMTQMITEPSLMNDITNLTQYYSFSRWKFKRYFFWNEPQGIHPADAPA